MDLEAELKRTLSECTSPSPLADALADKKLPFYVRNGAYPYAIDALDKGMEAHPDADSDPNYVPFMEMLALVLYKGENLVQADVILDRLRTHVQERGLPLSPVAENLEQNLRQSALYRLQHTMEHSGVDFDV
jgi:hypothetical protein